MSPQRGAFNLEAYIAASRAQSDPCQHHRVPMLGKLTYSALSVRTSMPILGASRGIGLSGGLEGRYEPLQWELRCVRGRRFAATGLVESQSSRQKSLVMRYFDTALGSEVHDHTTANVGSATDFNAVRRSGQEVLGAALEPARGAKRRTGRVYSD